MAEPTNLFAHTLPRQGIEVRFVSADDPDAFESRIDDRTKLIFCETVGNPAGNIVDIEKLATIGHRHGVPCLSTTRFPLLPVAPL